MKNKEILYVIVGIILAILLIILIVMQIQNKQKQDELQKQQEIEQYFKIIGTNNKKHYNRFKEFKMEGRVRRMVRHQSRKLEPRKGFVGSSPTPSARWI